MIYEITISPQAKEDLQKLKQNEPWAFNKARRIIQELQFHPRTGTGKPKPLSGNRSGQWSRRITQKHRLIYSILDDVVKVYVLSSWGHYGDK